MKIFISYTTKDGIITKSLLNNLYNKLSLNNRVYIDILHNNSINKQKRVFDELHKADIVLLLKTNKTYHSHWVGVELEFAKKKNIDVIQVNIDEVNKILTSKLEINEIIEYQTNTVANIVYK